MPVSNPAKMSSIKAEFGGTNKLSDYRRGGTYVPSNSASTISTTVNGLAISQFSGVSKPAPAPSLTLQQTDIWHGFYIPEGFGLAEANAAVYLNLDGKVNKMHTFNGGTSGGNWLSGAVNGLLQYKVNSISTDNIGYGPYTITKFPNATTGWLDLNSHLTIALILDRSNNSSNWWVNAGVELNAQIGFRFKSNQQSLGNINFTVTVSNGIF